MGTFFIAVIFACLNDSCSFGYSKVLYDTHSDCMKSLNSEMNRMQSAQPGTVSHGSCLEFKQATAAV